MSPFAVVVAQPRTYMEVILWPKKHLVLKDKSVPPITLPEYTWVDGKVGTYFYRYNYESNLLNLLSWLPISMMTKAKYYLVTLRKVWSDATPFLKLIFMN